MEAAIQVDPVDTRAVDPQAVDTNQLPAIRINNNLNPAIRTNNNLNPATRTNSNLNPATRTNSNLNPATPTNNNLSQATLAIRTHHSLATAAVILAVIARTQALAVLTVSRTIHHPMEQPPMDPMERRTQQAILRATLAVEDATLAVKA